VVLDCNSSHFRGDFDRPVEQRRWFAAQEFCLRLSQATGLRLRLPSEAEWGYAGRAGTTSKYPWGKAVTAEQVNGQTGDPLDVFLNGTEGGEQEVGTNVKGRYPANAWGSTTCPATCKPPVRL
jgi:formylglycine-generating enzyme required for sulfatase activity